MTESETEKYLAGYLQGAMDAGIKIQDANIGLRIMHVYSIVTDLIEKKDHEVRNEHD